MWASEQARRSKRSDRAVWGFPPTVQYRISASEEVFVEHAAIELAGAEALDMTTIAFTSDGEKVMADYTNDRFPESFNLLVPEGE